MQKIRRKYEGNRLFDCHVRGTICSLNEKRPWLNGITLEMTWRQAIFRHFQIVFEILKSHSLNDNSAAPPHCHFDRSRPADNRIASYWAGWRPTLADLETLCRVSTEWRNLTLKWCTTQWDRRFLDSEPQIELKAFVSIPTCSPARNDMEADSLYPLGGAKTAFRMAGLQ